LTLPEGFCASVFADNLGHARHVAVAADGTVYVNTQRKDSKAPPGGFLVALRDADGDGVAESTQRFGEDSRDRRALGGTGVALYKGYLYAEASGRIVRYPIERGQLAPQAAELDIIVDDLPMKGNHTMHPIAISRDGALYLNVGSASNACQVKDRAPHSPGRDPCEELEERAGLWTYDANVTGQRFERAGRYARGLRNSVALAVHPVGALFAVPHGRDQLHENWPERFDVVQGAELPAEAMYRIARGADYGWPYCYYDGRLGGYFLAPEYGGDGRKTERCADKPKPVASFPAHWAPNALLFYTGAAFPDRYANGAFIAFHGSWNRPQQQGYNVVFVPLDGSGNPSGNVEIFADGFAGPVKTPEGAAHRPSGLAMGPDGALYISDDQRGRIWKVVRK
jgi:glucose/arabinose dehydrogenase